MPISRLRQRSAMNAAADRRHGSSAPQFVPAWSRLGRPLLSTREPFSSDPAQVVVQVFERRFHVGIKAKTCSVAHALRQTRHCMEGIGSIHDPVKAAVKATDTSRAKACSAGAPGLHGAARRLNSLGCSVPSVN